MKMHRARRDSFFFILLAIFVLRKNIVLLLLRGDGRAASRPTTAIGLLEPEVPLPNFEMLLFVLRRFKSSGTSREEAIDQLEYFYKVVHPIVTPHASVTSRPAPTTSPAHDLSRTSSSSGCCTYGMPLLLALCQANNSRASSSSRCLCRHSSNSSNSSSKGLREEGGEGCQAKRH